MDNDEFNRKEEAVFQEQEVVDFVRGWNAKVDTNAATDTVDVNRFARDAATTKGKKRDLLSDF